MGLNLTAVRKMVMTTAPLLPLVMTLLATQAAAAASRSCLTNCGLIDFSYPFGIGSGCSLPGFNLTCDANTYRKILWLGSPNVTVDYLITSRASVSALAVRIVRSVLLTPDAGTLSSAASWDGPGRPFAISGTSNMSLFVLGCGVTATLLDRGTGTAVGNCSVVCAGVKVMQRLPEGLCVGVGCCRIDLRVPLRAFNLNLSRTGDSVSRDRLSFLVTSQNGYRFRPSDLEHGVDAKMVAPALLDWAIPDQPDCQRAMEDRATYACVSKDSECRDSPIGGYVCHCSTGFSGNAYVVDGCVPDQVYGSTQPKANCPARCGNVSVPFPFGTELGCFARIHLYLTCNPGPSPAILQMTEHQVVTDISIDEGVLRIQKLYDPGGFLGDRDTTLYSFSRESGMVKWAVDSPTCGEAMLNKNEYRCFSAHSHCVDVTDDRTSMHVGYRCRCSPGFQGNPYLEDGCADINECLQPDKYTCNGICHNSLGSYSCSSCPRGTDFDRIARECRASNVILGITIGLSSAGGILFLAAIAVIVIRRWKKGVRKQLRRRHFRKNKGILLEQLVSSDPTASDSTRIFSLAELEKATDNFDRSRVLGRGGHGTVYKGILTDQRVVAIKRAKLAASAETDQFINEVAILSQINHRNVVKLHGCCLEAEVPLLVYEFVSNGTLYGLLHREQDGGGGLLPLPWQERLRLATEVAGPLTYLHSAASMSILHRDIKSMNVLLNDSHTAKVSDFGASRSIPIDQTHVVTAVQGTFGYLDPEYYHTGRLTEKSDVYSFGVILVELLTRKKPIAENENGEMQNLSNYFLWAMGERRLKEIVDGHVMEGEDKEVIEHMAGLARECLNLRGQDRPSMKDVEMRLQFLRARKALAPREDDEVVIRRAHPGAGRDDDDGRRAVVPVAGRDGTTRQYSLEQEFVSSLRIPR